MTKISFTSSGCWHKAARQASIRPASFSTGKSTVTRSLEGIEETSMRNLVLPRPNKDCRSFQLPPVVSRFAGG